MAYRKTNYLALVVGLPGQGKSTISNHMRRGRRTVVFDQNGEYAGAHRFREVRSVDALRKALVADWYKTFSIAFVPTPGMESAQLSEVSALLCQAQMPYFKSPDGGRKPPIPKVLFIVEEMDASFPSRVYEGGFAEICSRGRHYGIDVIGVTTAISQISTRFRRVCGLQFYFAQTDHNDKKILREVIGPVHAEKVATFPPHHYVRRFQGQITYHKTAL